MVKIDKNTHYSVRQITENKWLPWATSHPTLTEFLNTKKGRSVLKPIIKHTDKYRKYYVKGETLIDVIKKSETGTLEV